MARFMKPSPRIVRIYEDLLRAGEAAGFAAEVAWCGHNDGITFGTESGVPPVFWAGRREWGALVCLPRPHPFYRLAEPARLRDACVAIMGRILDASVPLWTDSASFLAYSRAAEAGAVPRWFDADFEREFGLVPMPRIEWDEAESEERHRRLARTGWWRIPEDEDRAVWDRVEATFGYALESRIRVPDGARGFDIDAAFADADDATASRLATDMAFRILNALRKATRPGGRLHVVEWQGPCWSFDPHADITEANRDTLTVPFLPDGDPVYFLAPDFRFGLLGRYFEPQMYVFGDELIAAFGDEWPEAFTALP